MKKCGNALKPYGIDNIFDIIENNQNNTLDNVLHSFVKTVAIQVSTGSRKKINPIRCSEKKFCTDSLITDDNFQNISVATSIAVKVFEKLSLTLWA